MYTSHRSSSKVTGSLMARFLLNAFFITPLPIRVIVPLLVIFPLPILIDQRDPNAVDTEGNTLPGLVYMAHETRPEWQAGAMNALVGTLIYLTHQLTTVCFWLTQTKLVPNFFIAELNREVTNCKSHQENIGLLIEANLIVFRFIIILWMFSISYMCLLHYGKCSKVLYLGLMACTRCDQLC